MVGLVQDVLKDAAVRLDAPAGGDVVHAAGDEGLADAQAPAVGECFGGHPGGVTAPPVVRHDVVAPSAPPNDHGK